MKVNQVKSRPRWFASTFESGWGWIKGALAKLGVPSYLARLIESYLSDRLLWYETDDGPKDYIVTAGVPQGSVLGPLLLNIT